MGALLAADAGTARMQEITRAIREGADAYLKRQFTAVGALIIILTGVLILTKWPWSLASTDPGFDEQMQVAVGRGLAFLIGAFIGRAPG